MGADHKVTYLLVDRWMKKQMKIYEFAGFPNPARIRIALAEKGLTESVEFVSVDVPAAGVSCEEPLSDRSCA